MGAAVAASAVAGLLAAELLYAVRSQPLSSAALKPVDVYAARFLVDNKEFGCTVSVGVITFDARVTSPQMLYEMADKNLYAAKNSGRNRVVG